MNQESIADFHGQKPSRPRSRRTRNKPDYEADFETTTDPKDCRVWGWGIADVNSANTIDDVEYGPDIVSFIDWISTHDSTCYFHNLKFDGSFILDYLFNHGYKHVPGDARISSGTFKTLISDMGKFYSITVAWYNGTRTEFRDSYKKIPLSVKRVAKAFNLAESKGEIDYDAPRPVGYQMTPEEREYLGTDVLIAAKAMREVLDAGMTRLTVASDSLSEYKKILGATHFQRLFPVYSESMDSEIRRAYRGGFTYADPRFKTKLQGGGIVLDVNSLYPSVMYNEPMPYGEPQFIDGKVTTTKDYPLAIFSVTFTAKLKENHIPCIQIKNSGMFTGTEYLSEIPEPTTIMVTNVDWKLYNDHYHIVVQAWGGGWRFKAATGFFAGYIDKWSAVKENSVGGKREIAKLHLNSLYGKFASNPNVTGKVPILKDGIVRFVKGPPETRPPVFTAVGVFITSYGRDLTIRAAQLSYDVFAYADTDSLHLLTDTVPEGLDIHPTRMGAWKLEYAFTEAFYIRAKAYMERHPDGTYTNRIAGLPEVVSAPLTFDDVADGKILHGKLAPKHVPGGVVLADVPYQLKF